MVTYNALANVAIDDTSSSEVVRPQEAMNEMLVALIASPNQKLKVIALMCLVGIDTHEMAERLRSTPRTIQRKLPIFTDCGA